MTMKQKAAKPLSGAMGVILQQSRFRPGGLMCGLASNISEKRPFIVASEQGSQVEVCVADVNLPASSPGLVASVTQPIRTKIHKDYR